MNHPITNNPCRRGAVLLEVMIAIGVLAMAIPLVFGALAESGKSGMASQAETRSTWMIPFCMEEIHASREGRSQYFSATTTGQTFPATGDIWALAFSPDGSPIGKLSKATYDRGTGTLDGKPVRYIASMSSSTMAAKPGTTPMLQVHISMEYPATALATKRSKLDFHTLIP